MTEPELINCNEVGNDKNQINEVSAANIAIASHSGTSGACSITPTKPTSSSSSSHNISPAFADTIIWPTESPKKSITARKKLRLPHAATSSEWLKYWKEKEEEKQKRDKESKDTEYNRPREIRKQHEQEKEM